jgi:plasmid stabilization system protein ParE
MTSRPPRPQAEKARENALDYEIVQEQAATLCRLGRALEAALAALADHDRTHAPAPGQSAARQRLLQKAGYALWCFVIQREVCGLRDQRLLLRDFRVPRDVQNRMGVFGPGGRRPQA